MILNFSVLNFFMQPSILNFKVVILWYLDWLRLKCLEHCQHFSVVLLLCLRYVDIVFQNLWGLLLHSHLPNKWFKLIYLFLNVEIRLFTNFWFSEYRLCSYGLFNLFNIFSFFLALTLLNHWLFLHHHIGADWEALWLAHWETDWMAMIMWVFFWLSGFDNLFNLFLCALLCRLWGYFCGSIFKCLA